MFSIRQSNQSLSKTLFEVSKNITYYFGIYYENWTTSDYTQANSFRA